MKKSNSNAAKALIAVIIITIVVIGIAFYWYFLTPTPPPSPSTKSPSPQISDENSFAPAVSSPPPTVEAQFPVAKISCSQTSFCVGDQVTFNAAESYDPDGNIVSYEWTGPNGLSGTAEDFECQFTSSGTYTVGLTVTDNDKYTDYTFVEIDVTNAIYTLQEAINGGYVQAIISGDGSCCGDCINLQLTRLSDKIIEIEPFTVGTLLSTTGDAQNMVVLELTGKSSGANMYIPTNQIILETKTQVTYIYRAYCLNFHKANPQSTDSFEALGTADTKVVKVLNALEDLPSNVTSLSAVQTAIWAVTDNVSLSELQEIFPSGAARIQSAKTILEAAGIDTSSLQLFS